MAVKRTLSDVTAKAVGADDMGTPDKPKVQAGIDCDGQVFQITLPLIVNEADLTITEAKRPNTGEVYDKANVCFKFQAKDLTLAVRMEDGSTRFYRVKNNAGPYGADRYISLGFDPTVYSTSMAESAEA